MENDIRDFFAGAIFVLVPMILSLTVHEFAHAAAAKALGDDTAEKMGRLNLNPLTHIDPVGTVILPLVLLFVGGGFFFGWAKPVPYNPTRFSKKVDMRTGSMLVAAAGPASNLILAVLCMGLIAVGFHGVWLSEVPEPLRVLLQRMVLVNLALCVFNMIPIYPLDGQKVLSGLLPLSSAIQFERFNRQYGTFLLMLLVLFAGQVMAVPYSFLLRALTQAFGVSTVG